MITNRARIRINKLSIFRAYWRVVECHSCHHLPKQKLSLFNIFLFLIILFLIISFVLSIITIHALYALILSKYHEVFIILLISNWRTIYPCSEIIETMIFLSSMTIYIYGHTYLWPIIYGHCDRRDSFNEFCSRILFSVR